MGNSGVAGHRAEFWLEVFQLTHRPSSQGPVPWCTADGRPPLAQPWLLQQALAAIRAEALDALAQ
jgi:hypothetical protein